MLFDEITFLVEILLQDARKQSIARKKGGYLDEDKRMCRASYNLYLSIEEIQRNMQISLGYFVRDYEVLYADTTSFATPKDKWIYFTNEAFSSLSKSVAQFVQKAHYGYDNFSYAKNLESFLSCKSGWVPKFTKKYKSAVVDGEKLEICYLPLARPLDEMGRKGYDSRSFVKDPTIIALECSTHQQCLDIELCAQKNIEKIAAIQEKYKKFILKHCTLHIML